MAFYGNPLQRLSCILFYQSMVYPFSVAERRTKRGDIFQAWFLYWLTPHTSLWGLYIGTLCPRICRRFGPWQLDLPMKVTQKKARNEKEWFQTWEQKSSSGVHQRQSRTKTIVTREQIEQKGAQGRWAACDLEHRHWAAWGLPFRWMGPGKTQLGG